MKKSELREIIREEIQRLNENVSPEFILKSLKGFEKWLHSKFLKIDDDDEAAKVLTKSWRPMNDAVMSYVKELRKKGSDDALNRHGTTANKLIMLHKKLKTEVEDILG